MKTLFGAELKQAREARKVTLRAMADDTRISMRHLENLEAGRFAELPGGMYNRAILRAYSEYLNLDPKDLLDKYETAVNPPAEKGTRSRPLSLPESNTTSNPALIWSVLLIFSVVGLLVSRPWIKAVFSPYFRTQGPPSGPAAHEPSEKAPQIAQPATLAPPPVARELLPEVKSRVPTPDSMLDLPQPPDRLHIEFIVVQKSWVSVNSDGNRILVKLLEPGDNQKFEASERFYLVIGNAAGVHLKINGKRARSLGGVGDIARLPITLRSYRDLLEPEGAR